VDETRWVWVGGESEPVRPADARIHATEHAYLYGSGLYETLRTYHARPFALDAHLRRLAAGASRMAWGDLPLQAIAEALLALAAKRAPEESYLRVAVGPGLQFPGWNEPIHGPVRWCAYAGPLAPHVAAVYERGVRCILSKRPRWNPGGFTPAVKFAANAELQLAKREADAVGAYEALLLNPEGRLAEGSSSSVFLVKERRVVTPDLASGILDGVTRSCVLELCAKAGLASEERPVAPEELSDAEEIFLTSTLKEVVPVVSLDGRPIGTGVPGVIADRLLGLFQELALESTSDAC
jgi:branched-chain amino acid aminotransferase